jgi:hypothetical protein
LEFIGRKRKIVAMRNLNTAKLTANYVAREAHITAAVWMPLGPRGTGTLRVHNHGDFYTADDAFGWVDSVHHFQTCTGLGPLLTRLGITTELEAPSDIQMDFLHPKAIAERVVGINRTLPDAHRLPNIEVYRGSTIPGDLFLGSIASDTVLLADGGSRRPTPRMGLPALVAAHDVAFHLPSRLAMDPASRAALGEQAANVLANPGEPYGGRTRIDELAGRIDKFIAPPNMGSGRFGCQHEPYPLETVGTETVIHYLSNVEVGGTHMPRERAEELGQLSVAHVAFLGEHIANLPK